MSTLFQIVKAGTTRLGTDPVRFFEFGTAPEGTPLPYATWQELSGEPFNYISGPPDADMLNIQIDIWGQSPAEVRDVMRDIRGALALAGQISFFQFLWDEESNQFRSIVHFTFAQGI